MKEVKQGWAWLNGSTKFHYFYDAKSLCGRWLYLGSALEPDMLSGKKSPDECAQCWKARDKMKAKATSG